MTLANCEKLLEHYENIISGKVQKPEGHKDWGLVVEQAKLNAERMKVRIESKKNHPKYAHLKARVEEKKEVKKEVKDGKK